MIFFLSFCDSYLGARKKSDAHLGNSDSYLGTYNKIYDS